MNIRVLLAALWFAAACPGAQANESISVGFLKGSSSLPMQVMQEQKLAEKHGLTIVPKEFVDLDSMDRAFVFGEFEIHLGLSLNTWGEYLNSGRDFVGIVGTLYPVGFVVVPASSPADSVADLRGKRIGVYGVTGTSTAIFGVVASERFQIDIRKDTKLFGSAPPALPALLTKGEIDAMLNLPFFVAKAVADAKARIIMRPAVEWERLTGKALPFTVAAVPRAIALSKGSALKAFVAAWQEAVQYVKEHPEALDPELARANITSPAAVKLTRELTIPTFMSSWTENDISSIRLYWDLAAKKGFLQKPVTAQHWYTYEFAR
jgi:ABC-type nitrate/sulfonate/bicarbonate transport system substrate-binding protein